VRLAFLRSEDDVAPPPPHVLAAVEAARVRHPDRRTARSAKAATAKNNTREHNAINNKRPLDGGHVGSAFQGKPAAAAAAAATEQRGERGRG